MNVLVPKDTHKVVWPKTGSDWNVYPAENAVILQGTVEGPIGDHNTLFWLTGSVPDVNPEGTTRLEAAVVFLDVDEESGETTYMAVPVPSSRDASGNESILLNVSAMTVRDTDGDGQYEVIAETTFRPCCEDDAAPYNETIVLHLSGTTITPSYPKP